MTSPDTEEKTLISDINQAIKSYLKHDQRDGYYLDMLQQGVTTPLFNSLAQRTAALIQKQGVAHTDPGLVDAARRIQSFGEMYNTESIACVFQGSLSERKQPNPFKKLSL